MEQCYSTVQGKKTNIYGKRQYDQLFTTFPKKLRRFWDMEKGEVIEWRINGDAEVTVKKVKTKPTRSQLKYEEWLTRIKPHIPTEGPGKTYEEICKEAGIYSKAASAIWVNRAKNDIGLDNTDEDNRHRTLWFRTTPNSTAVVAPPQDRKDQKQNRFRDRSLAEF
jgi:bifunctional DNA-binding transcriptional regulator/antitoxin component of YhaV-PrlF toxin-antitoxin module